MVVELGRLPFMGRRRRRRVDGRAVLRVLTAVRLTRFAVVAEGAGIDGTADAKVSRQRFDAHRVQMKRRIRRRRSRIIIFRRRRRRFVLLFLVAEMKSGAASVGGRH